MCRFYKHEALFSIQSYKAESEEWIKNGVLNREELSYNWGDTNKRKKCKNKKKSTNKNIDNLFLSTPQED